VDGLATWQPEEMAAYKPMGKRMAHEGYARPGLSGFFRWL
jgi:hypothetical protein